MSEPLQFLLSIEIRNDNHDNRIDIESLIKRASIAIADKAKYKLRVRYDVISLYSTVQNKKD